MKRLLVWRNATIAGTIVTLVIAALTVVPWLEDRSSEWEPIEVLKSTRPIAAGEVVSGTNTEVLTLRIEQPSDNQYLSPLDVGAAIADFDIGVDQLIVEDVVTSRFGLLSPKFQNRRYPADPPGSLMLWATLFSILITLWLAYNWRKRPPIERRPDGPALPIVRPYGRNQQPADAPLGETPTTPVRRDPTASAEALEEQADAPQLVPRVLLRVFGAPTIYGAAVSQATAAPFFVAAAGRPQDGDEIARWTTYSKKTLSSVFTTNHEVLTRSSGQLQLADGVYTEQDWVARCVHTAAGAADGGHFDVAAVWVDRALAMTAEIDGAAFECPAGNAHYWKWVDEYPSDVSARAAAEQTLITAVLGAITIAENLPEEHALDPDAVVDIVCRIARFMPYTPVPANVRPGEWTSSAEALLVAAHGFAGGDVALSERVAAVAKQLVAADIIEPSHKLADTLGI